MKEHILEFEKPIVELERELEELERKQASRPSPERATQMNILSKEIQEKRSNLYLNLTPWQRVQISRHPNRPYFLDYVQHAFSDFIELHGDRHVGDDNAMPAGLATIGGRKVVLIGQQKGRNTKENLKRNFGSAHPEGYRKALRLMKLAERVKLPVVTIIDTPGAYPGIGSEERNIAEAIAFNLREMMLLKTPVVSVVIGEGGSGGALGIGVSDRVLIMENAYYSVISPEGCAAILWKHRQHAPEAAEALKLSAPDLKSLGIVDSVVQEPIGGAHRDHPGTAAQLKQAVLQALEELDSLNLETLLNQRYEKFRKLGEFTES